MNGPGWQEEIMLRQIPVSLPESFEAALGYSGGLKWVAFYWEPCGDEAVFDDGFCSGDCSWHGFLNFVEHPKVKPWLAEYDLGSSEFEAKHWLLCDLVSREVYVGERAEVNKFLQEETSKTLPASPPLEVTKEELTEIHKRVLENIKAELKEVPTPSMLEIEAEMKKQHEAVAKMITELGEKDHA